MNYIIYVKYIPHCINLRLANRTLLLTSSKIMRKVFCERFVTLYKTPLFHVVEFLASRRTFEA